MSLQFDPGIKPLINPIDLRKYAEWYVGRHRLIEIIISYYSGCAYLLNGYHYNDFRIEEIRKHYPGLRKRKYYCPFQISNFEC